MSNAYPEELTSRPQWVVWKLEDTGRPKLAKIPYQPLEPTKRASSTDPQHWTTYKQAVDVWQHNNGSFSGVGFVFTKDDPFIGVDLDHCLDPESGALTPESLAIVKELDSYTEISQSGTGLHIFIKGELPNRGRRKGFIEMYETRRYFTMSGNRLEGTPDVIHERQVELESLHHRVFGETKPEKKNGNPHTTLTGCLDDTVLIKKAMAAKSGHAFTQLWNGDFSDYSSQSEADLALCSHLAFWTGGDHSAIDRLFRQSGLYREKWDVRHGEHTYGDATIGKAISDATEFYAHTAQPDYTQYMTLEGGGKVWPVLHESALHGLAGNVVQAIAPHTEADMMTLLVHFLSEFSCMIGRGPHILIDDEYSLLTFWPVVVGDTSKSRKGTGAKRIKRLMRCGDDLWTRGKHSGSLSSGEGLIYAVRDAEIGMKKGIEEVVDEGVEDKRLYLVQSEFGAMLRIMAREGNSLSGHLRDAWDGSTLKPMTKGNRIQATDPHIVVCGHVTQAELIRNLNDTEMANGFGNRFVWFCVKRSKFLPFADNPDESEMNKIVTQLKLALKKAKEVETIGMTDEAKDAWSEVYESLSRGSGGLAGALLDRAEAHVLRIAALYALLDCEHMVDTPHLFAAIALWEYADNSTRFIFHDKVGDPAADTILKALESGPKSDTDISALFGRHLSRQRLTQCKQDLLNSGDITSVEVETEGRTKIVWSLAKKAKKAKKAPG